MYTTQEALRNDYRHPKISQPEVASLKPQVTVIRNIVPIHTIEQQDPQNFGLMIRSAAKTAVVLPGEAKDAYYQLIQCRLKAGIGSQAHSRPGYQLYRIVCDVYK